MPRTSDGPVQWHRCALWQRQKKKNCGIIFHLKRKWRVPLSLPTHLYINNKYICFSLSPLKLNSFFFIKMRFGTRFDITIHLFLGNYDSGNPSNLKFFCIFFPLTSALISSHLKKKRRHKMTGTTQQHLGRLRVSDFYV